MSGAILLALAFDFALVRPHPDVRHEGGGGLLWAPPMVVDSTTGCHSTDLPAAFLLQPHAGNRGVVYSWRVLPPIRSSCAD